MLGSLSFLKNIISRILGRITKEKSEIIADQNKLNIEEISNAPNSHLRLWRSFLGWILAIVFAFEVVGRNIIITYWPDVVLPPSALESVMSILLGMLGLGF